MAACRRNYRAFRKQGHSKNGRFNAPQIVVGLAVTRDGFPVRHWIFAGNTVDVSIVGRVKHELQGWQLRRCVFVGDAGMVSKANLPVYPGAVKARHDGHADYITVYKDRRQISEEFIDVTGYHGKSAIRILNSSPVWRSRWIPASPWNRCASNPCRSARLADAVIQRRNRRSVLACSALAKARRSFFLKSLNSLA